MQAEKSFGKMLGMFARWKWLFLGMAFVGPMLGLLVSAALTYAAPKIFESAATFDIQPAEDSGERIARQNEFVLSDAVLARTVQELDLMQRWNATEERAIAEIRKMVTVGQIPGTATVRLSVRDISREDCRDIARELAYCYSEYFEDLNQTTISGAAPLSPAATLALQVERVEKVTKALNSIVSKRQVLLANQDPASGLPSLIAHDKAKRDLAEETARLEQVKIETTAAEAAILAGPPPVTMRDRPVIPQEPVSPDVELNMNLGMMGGFLLSPLMAFPVIAGLKRRTPSPPRARRREEISAEDF